MLDQEALGADELVTLHGDNGHRGVLVAQIGTRQFVILGNGVLIIVDVARGILRGLSQSLQLFLVLVLVTGGIIILSHYGPFVVYRWRSRGFAALYSPIGYMI